MGTCAQLEGHEDMFYNNTCIMTVLGESYANFQTGASSGGVAKPALPVMHDNRVFTPDGAFTASGVLAPRKLSRTLVSTCYRLLWMAS
jgi:hypothetical protein